MRTFHILLLFSNVVSALQWPLFIQRIFGPSYTGFAPDPVPLQLSKQPNCSTFLTRLERANFIVYNYGLDENTPGAGRDLVNCISTANATEARSKINEVLIAMPLVGKPKPGQDAFIELMAMLPNVTKLR
jgi:hypothetical protein